MPYPILIVRHGETEWSRQRPAHEPHRPAADPGGDDDAAAARSAASSRGREFALVLCSPLRRARETCELAGFGDRAEICDDLREWDYGEYEGLTTPQIRERNPSWNLWRDGCPGGEQPGAGGGAGRPGDRAAARAPTATRSRSPTATSCGS